MSKVLKSYSVTTKAIDADAGIFEAMISTENQDRHGDIVRAAGAQIENYLKNPVVLWAHEYAQPPIARALSIEIVPGVGLKSTFQFPEWGINPQADIIRRLWAGGFLNATSIGFSPIASEEIKGGDGGYFAPRDYKEWELLEFSIVPVPANQDALRLAMKALNTEQDLSGLQPVNQNNNAKPNTDESSNDESYATLAKSLKIYFENLEI